MRILIGYESTCHDVRCFCLCLMKVGLSISLGIYPVCLLCMMRFESAEQFEGAKKSMATLSIAIHFPTQPSKKNPKYMNDTKRWFPCFMCAKTKSKTRAKSYLKTSSSNPISVHISGLLFPSQPGLHRNGITLGTEERARSKLWFRNRNKWGHTSSVSGYHYCCYEF